MSPRSRTRKSRSGRPVARSASAPSVRDVVAAAVTTRPGTPAAAAPSEPLTPRGKAWLELTTLNCGPLREVEPRGLGMTYCFDTSRWQVPSRVTIRFDGRQSDAGAKTAPATFAVTDVVDVPPRAGRVTVTARSPNVTDGTWRVTATASVESTGTDSSSARIWRLPPSTAEGIPVFEPVTRVRAPGARLGVWPALVLAGALLAFASQLLVAPRLEVPAWRLVVTSVVASLVGLVTSKLYHKLLHPKESGGLLTVGMGIQGFVLGALAILVVGSAAVGYPLLRSLDVITPGLLLGMTVGRFGCFFGGCCAGRATSGRGLWSSDRHVGIRRIPVQLFESSVAGIAAVGAFVADVTRAAPPGTVFAGALAAYVLGRQLLIPLRDIKRQTRNGRRLMIVLCVAVLLGDLVVSVVTG